MAKGDPNSVTVQYKVHLKPTEIGRLVIERLQRPHMDVSPELRRFIELGYAAERAGFILDGTVLRHAGQAWDTQPDLTTDRSAEDPRPTSGKQTRPGGRSRPPQAERPAASTSDAAPSTAVPVPPVQHAEEGGQTKGSKRDRLRGLSS